MNRQRLLLLGCCLLLLLPACQGPDDGRLTVAFPLETTELAGGQSLRVTISLVDHDDQPIEGASIQAELRAPNGDVFATRPCVDKGQGRYLADYVRLPLRGAGGVWRVIARATWGDGKQAQAERTFEGVPSYSESTQSKYGFWIEVPDLFDCHENDQILQDWQYENGSGYVLLENHCHGGVNVTVSLDVHWQHADFPTDEATAIAHVRTLPVSMYHDPNASDTHLAAARTTFQGQSAWRVTGRWKSNQQFYAAGPVSGNPIEWVVLRCPGADWLWTLVISTNEAAYMDDLRVLRETFECPTPKSG